jgi:hypothetical protein
VGAAGADAGDAGATRTITGAADFTLEVSVTSRETIPATSESVIAAAIVIAERFFMVVPPSLWPASLHHERRPGD